MDERTENRIQGWDSKPLTGGFAELRELADGGFSGAARTATTTLFMLNGRVVGVFGGAIEDFDGADATAYQAPHPSLPLLFAMKEYGGDQRAQYYTNDTPISQAHQQLADAQFTGYIELSENVLSGDYYVVYYGGRSMSCAFVGNSERLETGDEAFELADDEVGIYEVMDVDIEVTDIPEPAGGGAAASGAGGQEATDPAGAGGVDQAPADRPGTDQGPADDAEPTGPADTGADQAATEAADPAAGAQGTGDAAAGGTQADQTTGTETDPRTEPAATEPADQPEAGGDQSDAGGAKPDAGADQSDTETAQDQGSAGSRAPGSEPDRNAAGASAPAETDAPAGAGADPEPEAGSPNGGTQPAGSAPGGTADSSIDPQSEAAADRAVEAASGPQGPAATGTATAGEGQPKSEAAFGELTPIPSLSPDRTAVAEPGEERGAADAGRQSTSTGGSPAGGAASGTASRSSDATATDGTASDAAGSASGRAGGSSATGGRAGGSDSRSGSAGAAASSGGGTDVTERATQEVDVDVDRGAGADPVPDDANAGELRQKLRAREERIEELEAAITDLRVQRDGLTDERDRLQSEVERLEGEVAELEAELERLRGQLDDGSDGKRRLSRSDALAGTNLFIRYGSKSGGTLEKAHRGDVGKEEVNNNLRLEHHTQFEADDVVVEGESFDEFLRGTIYRSFVEWIVRDLLYEIQDTGHVKGLQELYDAIPRIDRAELLGDVSVQFTEDGEEYREQRSFDVVLRDRMGNPLVVANLNDSRNPADREMMETVIGNAIDVKESNDSLSSALMVTASFFKPGALEAAAESAGGGLLSRDAKESYVKLDRKNGYHLVLVESREDDFHVNVPEL